MKSLIAFEKRNIFSYLAVNSLVVEIRALELFERVVVNSALWPVVEYKCTTLSTI